MIAFIQRQASKILIFFILAYSVIFSFLSFKKYYNFYYNGLDLSIFNQLFYNTIHGQWFQITFNFNNFLAEHFSPIIFLLLPVYSVWPDPKNLLIIQSVILALGAWPVYVISLRVLTNKLIALSISLLWLINFLLHNGNLFEWHFMPLAIFFILWAFYFYYIKKFKYFILFFILALLVREDISFVLLGFLPLAIIDKRSFKWIISPVFTILYFLISLKIISFFSGGDTNKFLLYYGWLGGENLISIILAWLTHPIEFIKHILNYHNLFNLLLIFLSLGLVPLIAYRYLWLLVFPLAQFLLSSQGLSSSVFNMHYGLLFLPALFIALIFSISKIKNKDKFLFSKIIYSNSKLFLLLFIFTVIYFSGFLSPAKNVLLAQNNPLHKDYLRDLSSLISKEDSLVVSSSLAPHFSSRQEIYFLEPSYLSKTQFYLHDFKFPEVDYILIDTEDMLEILSYYNQRKEFFTHQFPDANVPEDFRNRLADYNLIRVDHNLLLFQHQKLGSDINLLLYEFEDAPIDNNNLLLSSDFKDNVLKLDYKKVKDNNYLIRFYTNDNYYDVPLDYGLYPMVDWPATLASFHYYLNSDVYAYQLFMWQGEAKLGHLREVTLDLTLEPMTNVIYLSYQ